MTFKTGLRKTVEAVSSRNFSNWKNYKLQACVFSARSVVVFAMELYLQKQQGFLMGRDRRSCLGSRESHSPQLCTPPFQLHWGYPHHPSYEN